MKQPARAVTLVAAWSLPAATLLPPGNVLRITVVAAVLFLFPGLPLVLRLSNWRNAPTESSPQSELLRIAALAAGVSLASAVLVSQLPLLAGVFAPAVVLVVLALITTVAVLAPIGRRNAAEPSGDVRDQLGRP
jgi:hypothetical protein